MFEHLFVFIEKKKFHLLPTSNDSGLTNWLCDQEAYRLLLLLNHYS